MMKPKCQSGSVVDVFRKAVTQTSPSTTWISQMWVHIISSYPMTLTVLTSLFTSPGCHFLSSSLLLYSLPGILLKVLSGWLKCATFLLHGISVTISYCYTIMTPCAPGFYTADRAAWLATWSPLYYSNFLYCIILSLVVLFKKNCLNSGVYTSECISEVRGAILASLHVQC